MTTTKIGLRRSGRRFRLPSWSILVGGIAIGLLITVALMRWFVSPDTELMVKMVRQLVTYSAGSLALGFLVYRLGWSRSPSLMLTLVLTFIGAAGLTLFLVWIMANNMIAQQEDLKMAGVYLLFAAIIATCFGIAVTTRVTDAMSQLATTAQEVAEGNLAARVSVSGRDEVARLAEAFNQMAVQLEKAARERAEVERLRRDLIAWTSHDLRTPLTSIRAMIEALNDGLVDDPTSVRRYYQTLRADVIGLNQLIDDLFELAQLDAGGLTLELAPHSLSDLVSDSLESFRALADQRGVVIEGQVANDVDPVVLNPSRIGRVLANLLVNALNFTPAGGTVRVDVSRTTEGARVEVRDSGPGFSPTDLPRVFERFYRGQQARSRASGSAGLGLAIARGIVAAHGGRIWADNQPEGGAVIGFTLPGSGGGS